MTMTEPGTVAAPRNDTSNVEHVDVLVVGAGVAGIDAAYHLRERFPERSLVVLEAKDNRGGHLVDAPLSRCPLG
jgi:monooxygenase